MQAVLANVDSSPLDEKHKALFRFLDRVNAASHVEGEDLAALRAHGWNDEALYFAITVCALFNFYNRWVDATGVHAMSDEAHREGGKRMAVHGYIRS